MSATLIPFLYHTRTLGRLVGAVAPIVTCRSRQLHATTPSRRRKTGDPIPFQLPPELAARNPDATEQELAWKDGKSSITPLEAKAFENIFKQIAKRGEKPKLPNVTKLPPETEASTKPKFLKALLDEALRENQSSVNTIIQDAAEQQSNWIPGIRGLDALSPLEATFTAAEREKALLRFPPSLRMAARMALGSLEPAKNVSVTAEGGKQEALCTGQERPTKEAAEAVQVAGRLTKTLETEAQRRAEILRITRMMDAAKTDHELWDVIEKHVFTLVERLGVADFVAEQAPAAPPQNKMPCRRGRKKTDKDDNVAAQPAEDAVPAVETPLRKSPLSMDIYGPIYPTLLLDSLHLLDTKFSRTSPLAFKVLPRIKQLGLSSYVLGVSTSFYNRLITILWRRYGNVGGVLDMLEEMRHAGLYFDENTKSLVYAMEDVLRSAAGAKQGCFVQKMLCMPEYEPILEMRLKHWSSQLDRSIKERGIMLGF